MWFQPNILLPNLFYKDKYFQKTTTALLHVQIIQKDSRKTPIVVSLAYSVIIDLLKISDADIRVVTL